MFSTVCRPLTTYQRVHKRQCIRLKATPVHKGSQEQWQVELGTISENKARSKHIDQLLLKTKTDHSGFLKDYQNLRKVRENQSISEMNN